jgi:hypothetical protein
MHSQQNFFKGSAFFACCTPSMWTLPETNGNNGVHIVAVLCINPTIHENPEVVHHASPKNISSGRAFTVAVKDVVNGPFRRRVISWGGGSTQDA